MVDGDEYKENNKIGNGDKKCQGSIILVKVTKECLLLSDIWVKIW